MTEQQKEKLKDLLMRLKRVNSVYNAKKTTEDQRGRLLEASEKTILELVEMGYKREFVESLIIGGKDFVESLGEVKEFGTEEWAEMIFF